MNSHSALSSSPSDLVHILTAAIQSGDNDKAAEIVTELSSQKLKLEISLPKEDFEMRNKESEFR